MQWESTAINSTAQNYKVHYFSSQIGDSKPNQAPKTMPTKFPKGYSISAYKINEEQIGKEVIPLIVNSLIDSGVINIMSRDIRMKIPLTKKGKTLLFHGKEDNYKKNVKWDSINLQSTTTTETKPLGFLLDNALTWGQRKNYKLSVYYCQLALAHPEVRLPHKKSVLVAVMETYRVALKGLKRYEEMAVWSDSIYFYVDKFRKIENDAKISELIIQYETLEKEKQKKILEQQVALAKLNEQFYITVGALGLLCLIGLGLLLRRLSYKNSRLEKAMQVIQGLNKTKDFFMGIIAHDLRRPLSSLHGMAELVDFYIKTKRYDELKKVSISIDRSGAKIRKLLDNTLHWVMSQEGRYQPEPVTVADKINTVLELYTHSIQNQRIKLNIHCPTSLTVFADRNGLELILRNLLDNALKYLPDHGELSVKAFESPSGSVKIRVENTGRGIGEEKLAEIRYILAHADELIPGQIGNSLGMLLVGRFIKINQGAIEVESQLDAGAAFTLTLPNAKLGSENRKQTIKKRLYYGYKRKSYARMFL